MVCCCYHPPDINTFWDDFSSVLDEIKLDNSKYIYILGDINADFNTANGRKLNSLCINHNLSHLVTEPTRITTTSATVLDQILTNAPNFVVKVEVTPPISTNDHCTVSAILNFKVKKEPAYSCMVWQYSQADFNDFHLVLSKTDFKAYFETLLKSVLGELDSFLNCVRVTIPNSHDNLPERFTLVQ